MHYETYVTHVLENMDSHQTVPNRQSPYVVDSEQLGSVETLRMEVLWVR